MPRRTPTPSSITGLAFSNVGVTMSGIPAVRNVVENIRHMRERALVNIEGEMSALAGSMERIAQDLAHRSYESHYERHPSPRYPSGEVAADSIVGRVHRTGEEIFITLEYGPDVIQTVGTRAPITYAGILEAEYHGATSAVRPTWEDAQASIAGVLSGALSIRGAGSRRFGKSS